MISAFSNSDPGIDIAANYECATLMQADIRGVIDSRSVVSPAKSTLTKERLVIALEFQGLK